MKKLSAKLALILFVVTALALSACGSSDNTLAEWVEGETFTLRIGATARPHAEILEYIRPHLLNDGIELYVVPFSEFVLVNPALHDGTLDANYFQHRPFLETFPQADDLYMLGLIHIEPIGAYSSRQGGVPRYHDISELPEGATIAIPNDATNHGRALLLLQENGLITVNPDAGIRGTYSSDITSNPLNLQFRALDAALLPRMLEDPSIDIAIINTNHVLAGTDLDPVTDSLIMESPDSPFANGLTVRAVDKDHQALHILLGHLQSERVREFIYREYNNAVLPVF